MAASIGEAFESLYPDFSAPEFCPFVPEFYNFVPEAIVPRASTLLVVGNGTVKRAPAREIFAWCTFDFANSGDTTVIITAVFNVYFVSVVAENRPEATLLWTLALSCSYLAVLITAPILGAI